MVDRIAKPAVIDDEIKPLSFVERELASVAKERAGNPFTASQTLKGVQFPIDQNATERLWFFNQYKIHGKIKNKGLHIGDN